MDTLIQAATTLRLLDWRLDTRSGELLHLGSGSRQRLEGRPLQLLIYLASRAGEVVSQEELLDQVWPGVVVSPDSVYQAIAALRRTLGDDPRQARYIATVPRQGYRLLPRVEPVTERQEPLVAHEAASPGPATAPGPKASRNDRSIAAPRSRRRLLAATAGTGLALCLGLGWAWQRSMPAAPVGSLAVLPFLDLTDAMDAEALADGMTEQLIDALGQQGTLQVQARSRVFAYKGLDWTATRIGQELGVARVLEGSIRGDGQALRINAQLVQVSDGKVLWSASYDRPRAALLSLQGELAQAMVRALPIGKGP